MKVIQVGNVTDSHISRWDNPSIGRVYDPKGISPCLNSMTGWGRTPLIIVRENREENKSEKCNEKRIPGSR